MATHAAGRGNEVGSSLPGVLPFDLKSQTRTSWELGDRIVDGEDAERLGKWAHVESPWKLSVFRVTSTTALLRIRTPIGRERFVGTTLAEVETARSALEADDAWRRVE